MITLFYIRVAKCVVFEGALEGSPPPPHSRERKAHIITVVCGDITNILDCLIVFDRLENTHWRRLVCDDREASISLPPGSRLPEKWPPILSQLHQTGLLVTFNRIHQFNHNLKLIQVENLTKNCRRIYISTRKNRPLIYKKKNSSFPLLFHFLLQPI